MKNTHEDYLRYGYQDISESSLSSAASYKAKIDQSCLNYDAQTGHNQINTGSLAPRAHLVAVLAATSRINATDYSSQKIGGGEGMKHEWKLSTG